MTENATVYLRGGVGPDVARRERDAGYTVQAQWVGSKKGYLWFGTDRTCLLHLGGEKSLRALAHLILEGLGDTP